ncbi:MAG: cytochrome c biogenesis protein CcdA [Chloroflexota bacterium]|nr:cytochrome c biogenesis protein CcdA [Chloroflexota bacterium]
MKKLITNNLIVTFLITITISFLTFYTDLFTNTYINQVLKISSEGSNAISSTLDIFNFGYSFVAGVLAAINPCGIVMLPVYLGLYVYNNSDSNDITTSRKIVNSVNIILFVGIGFVALFSLAAIIVSLSSELIGDLIPFISILLSLLILYFGIGELSGEKFFSTKISSISSKIGNPKNINPIGFILFGISYGLASVGCALPIFISVVTKSINSSNNQSTFIDFISYSFGMISVITILTIATFISVNSTKIINNFFRKWSSLIFGIFLTLAGIFMLSYWVYDIKILFS